MKTHENTKFGSVMLVAMGFFGTSTGWPDVVVAAVISSLGLWGGWQIVSQARGGLLVERTVPPAVAAE